MQAVLHIYSFGGTYYIYSLPTAVNQPIFTLLQYHHIASSRPAQGRPANIEKQNAWRPYGRFHSRFFQANRLFPAPAYRDVLVLSILLRKAQVPGSAVSGRSLRKGPLLAIARFRACFARLKRLFFIKNSLFFGGSM